MQKGWVLFSTFCLLTPGRNFHQKETCILPFSLKCKLQLLVSFSGVQKERPIFPHIQLLSNTTFGDDDILSPAIKITIHIANMYLVVCLSILCMVRPFIMRIRPQSPYGVKKACRCLLLGFNLNFPTGIPSLLLLSGFFLHY